MRYLVFVVAAAVAMFAVFIGMAFKAGADAGQCGGLDDEDEPDGAEEDAEEKGTEEDAP